MSGTNLLASARLIPFGRRNANATRNTSHNTKTLAATPTTTRRTTTSSTSHRPIALPARRGTSMSAAVLGAGLLLTRRTNDHGEEGERRVSDTARCFRVSGAFAGHPPGRSRALVPVEWASTYYMHSPMALGTAPDPTTWRYRRAFVTDALLRDVCRPRRARRGRRCVDRQAARQEARRARRSSTTASWPGSRLNAADPDQRGARSPTGSTRPLRTNSSRSAGSNRRSLPTL